MSASFQPSTDMLHIRTKSVCAESADSMSIAERYDASIRRAFNIISKEAPDIRIREEAVEMAVKAINDSGSSEELVPTLLILRALPRLGLTTEGPIPSTFKIALVL